MAKYQLIFEDDDKGCVECPYSYYSDGFEYDWEDESQEHTTLNQVGPCGFYCSKTKKYLGNYTNRHGLIPIPDWCETVKKVLEEN